MKTAVAVKKPKHMYQPPPKVKPLSSATPSAPTGNVERWLVTHKRTGGVLSVVWDYYWFGARARAEWVHGLPRDDLVLEHMPLLQEERVREYSYSGQQLAARLGLKLHVEGGVITTHVPSNSRKSNRKKKK